MDDTWLLERFEEQRPQLRAMAYRMLGSVAEADDALQDAWLRVSRSGADDVDNVGGWLTTVVSRVCLNALRSRHRRGEEPLELHLPDPVVTAPEDDDPERRALVADSVGIALLVVLEQLDPAERLAFVMHDMFGVPFDEIAEVLDRTPPATRQLASRARRRVRGEAPTPDADLARQREVVDAFFAAAHGGDFDKLLTVLHPDVVLRADGGTALPQLTRTIQGAEAVVSQARLFSQPVPPMIRRVLVNGVPGVLTGPPEQPQALLAFTVVDDRIVAIDVLADPERLGRLEVPGE